MVLAASGVVPAGMVAVSVPAGGLHLTLTGYDYNTFLPAPSFLIDRQEVTNAEFKAFVDAGGYQKRDYWTEPFSRDGKTLEWEEAMAIFRDRTGRPGPDTWQGGSPPAGQEQHPVTGVSWFEAAAYAAYRGKRLPTIYHWSHAARPELGEAVTRTANFGGPGPLPATASRGLGAYGTVDMAGNVREWVWNDTGDGARYILGGAWNDPDYQFLYSDTRSPFDRSATNGFRCMKDGEIAAPAAFSASLPTPFRNYAGEKPVSDALYHIYAKQYEYDRTPLEARTDRTDDRSPHWKHETVTIAAAYGGERLPIHLYPSEKGEAPLPGDPLLPWIERDQTLEQRRSRARGVRLRLRAHERPGGRISRLQVHLRATGSESHIVVAGTDSRLLDLGPAGGIGCATDAGLPRVTRRNRSQPHGVFRQLMGFAAGTDHDRPRLAAEDGYPAQWRPRQRDTGPGSRCLRLRAAGARPDPDVEWRPGFYLSAANAPAAALRNARHPCQPTSGT